MNGDYGTYTPIVPTGYVLLVIWSCLLQIQYVLYYGLIFDPVQNLAVRRATVSLLPSLSTIIRRETLIGIF